MSEYTDRKQTQPEQPKNGDGPQREAGNISCRGKRTSQRLKLCQEDRTTAPTKTVKKRKTYRKNRHKLNHNLCTTYPFLSICNEIPCNECKNKCDNNQELVILSKQTLTQAQKDVLKKGLSFIPKPKKLNIHQLHNDLRLFTHRMKCKFEFYHKPQ